MNETSATDRPTMPKTQKTFYLDDDLAALLEAYQQRAGASFTRVVTAALIGYLFNGLDEPNHRSGVGPDPLWMKAAWRLERGDVKADDMVWWLIEEFLSQGHRMIIGQSTPDEGDKPMKPDPALVKQVGCAETMRALLDSHVRRHAGDKHAAIMELLEDRYLLSGFQG